MDVGFLGVSDTMRVAIAALLRDGAIGRVGIVANVTPANVLYYLTTTWTGERARLDGRLDGTDLVIRGRYTRGGLREDVIAIRAPDNDDLTEFVGSYDLWIDAGADAATGEGTDDALRDVLGDAKCRTVSWTTPSALADAVWPWDSADVARDWTRVRLPPGNLVVGVAALRIAATMGQLASASAFCVGPSAVRAGEARLLAGADVLNVSWEPDHDLTELAPDSVGLDLPLRFARVRTPVTRGGSVVVVWEWRDRLEEPNFLTAVRHAVRGELDGVLTVVDHGCESSAAFSDQAMGVLPRNSLRVSPDGGMCGIAISDVDAASVQLVKLIAQIEEHDMVTSTGL
jgi:hypothetical protein